MNIEGLESRLLLSDALVRTTQDSNPKHLAVFDDTLYFSADDGVHGTELWKSDGTAAGTLMVKDILPGAGASGPQAFTFFKGAIHFLVTTHNGIELWKTDGTAEGTTFLTHVAPASFIDLNVVNTGNLLMFSTGQAIYATDGTAGGTHLIAEFPDTTENIWDLALAGDAAYFLVSDPVERDQLWKTDGTNAVLVKDLNEESAGADYFYPVLLAFAGRAYFTAKTNAGGIELWTTDGTTNGTVQITDVEREDPYFEAFTVIEGALYFAAEEPNTHSRLWKIDAATPTVATPFTRVFNLIRPPIAGENGVLYFPADELPYLEELWKSDGTDAGTKLVADLTPNGSSSLIEPLVFVDGDLYFNVDLEGLGWELWRTDGTSSGTHIVKDIAPGEVSSYVAFFDKIVVIDGTLFFSAYDGVHGHELWKSDGTEAGTVMVEDINTLDPPAIEYHIDDFAIDVHGTIGDDTIVLTTSGEDLVVTRNGTSETININNVFYIRVVPEQGNDFIDASTLPQLTSDGFIELMVEAGDGNDTIIGTNGPDRIAGQDGDDCIIGNLGADRLDGGAGRDHIFGGGGNDRITGGPSRDFIYGQGGNDHIFGEGGRDHLHGGGGIDLLDGGGRPDFAVAEHDDLLNSIEQLLYTDG